MEDAAFTLIGCLISAVIFGMLGRKSWRYRMLLHLPYEDRVKLAPLGSGMAGNAVPIIPKNRWW